MSENTAIVLVVAILAVAFSTVVIAVVLAAIRGWVDIKRIDTRTTRNQDTAPPHALFDDTARRGP